MIDVLSVVLAALAGLATLGAVLLAALDKRISWTMLGVLGILELGLLVQLVAGIVQLASTEREVSGVSFVGYLVAAALVLPIGALWALAEPSRWGAGALAVACIVVPVLVLRLDQIWAGV